MAHKPKSKKRPPQPHKAARPSRQSSAQATAGLAWYTPESYARLLEVSADRAERHATYQEWLDSASDALIQFQIMGVPIQKVVLNVDDFVKWCRVHGHTIDRHACSTYVSHLLTSGKATIIP